METLRYGNLGIRKGHLGGRRYQARVIDYSAPDPERLVEGGRYRTVYWATAPGWTKEARDECRRWILAALNAERRSYPVVCHVCGARSRIEAEFLSGDVRWDDRDGIYRTIRACPTHTAAEVRAAWEARV